jgi:hypothetical protein
VLTLVLVLLAIFALLVLSPLRMASAMEVEKLRARLSCKLFDHDPGATTPILASPDGGVTPWVFDMEDFPGGVLVGVKPSVVGGAGISLVRLLASTGSDGTGSVTEVKTSGALQLDSLSADGGDQAWLECLPSEFAQISESHRYLTVEITMATLTDEAVVCVIGLPRYPRSGLTATQQA